jgi:hypothetical protein
MALMRKLYAQEEATEHSKPKEESPDVVIDFVSPGLEQKAKTRQILNQFKIQLKDIVHKSTDVLNAVTYLERMLNESK